MGLSGVCALSLNWEKQVNKFYCEHAKKACAFCGPVAFPVDKCASYCSHVTEDVGKGAKHV